jgi:hypothetical protein
MGRIWNILCFFAMLKKTVMAEGIYDSSVVQLEFSILGYGVSSFIGGQNSGIALWSHLQGLNVQRLSRQCPRGTENKTMAEWSIGFLR